MQSVFFCLIQPALWKGAVLFEGSQATSACSSGNSSIHPSKSMRFNFKIINRTMGVTFIVPMYTITTVRHKMTARRRRVKCPYSAPTSTLKDEYYDEYWALWARGGAVGWGTAIQAGRSRVRFPKLSLEFYIDIISSGRTMALESTQPLTEMSRGIFLVGKGDRCVGLTTLPPLCADCFDIWEPKTPGTLRACPGL